MNKKEIKAIDELTKINIELKQKLREADEAVEYWQKECDKRSKVLDKIKEKVNQYELIKGYYDYIEENGYAETTSHDTLKEDILKLLGEIE